MDVLKLLKLPVLSGQQRMEISYFNTLYYKTYLEGNTTLRKEVMEKQKRALLLRKTPTQVGFFEKALNFECT